MRSIFLLLGFSLSLLAGSAFADEIGTIKLVNGVVTIERDSGSVAAAVGAPVFQQDRLVTGPDGSIGILFADDSRVSLGPDSELALDEFRFDPQTDEGAFDLSVVKGVLSVIAGKLTRKDPESLKVKTPSAVLAVRGTEFSVRVYPE